MLFKRGFSELNDMVRLNSKNPALDGRNIQAQSGAMGTGDHLQQKAIDGRHIRRRVVLGCSEGRGLVLYSAAWIRVG